MEAHALYRRGWTIAAIARHLGRDRKTVRAYVLGERTPGKRRRGRPGGMRRDVPVHNAPLLVPQRTKT